MHRLVFILMLTLAVLRMSGPLLGEERFPPPDFESGHVVPETTKPAARSLALETLDVAVLIAALALGSWLSIRRRSRRGLIGLAVFSVAYFGFFREGCVCAIGSVQNVALALGANDYAIPLTVLAFFVAPLIFTLFFGRTFCAAVCPHGALQDLVLLKPLKVPMWLEQSLGLIPFVYLGAAVLFAASGSAFIICRYDPFIAVFRMSGGSVMVTVSIAFLVVAVFVGRPYCRFLCPYGALLRLGSAVSKWRTTVTPNVCTQCRLCEASCPYGALRVPSTGPTAPESVTANRRQLGRSLLILPIALIAFGWIGSALSTPLSRIDPTVALAERYLAEQDAMEQIRAGSSSGVPAEPIDPSAGVHSAKVATPDHAMIRAERNPAALISEAVAIRARFATGGWMLGCWIGLVIGIKFITVSFRRGRIDYEPDRSACVACARCFASCPNERARWVGAIPLSANGLHVVQ